MHGLLIKMKQLRTTTVICLLGATLTSCMVGPDYHPPAAPKTHSYTEAPIATKTIKTIGRGSASQSQHFIAGRDIPADWWKLFHSVEINNLIETGLNNSPNLQAAQAALVAAQENFNAQYGASLYPNVSLQLGAERQRQSTATFGGSTSSIFNLYNATANVSYTLDTFGAARRELESLKAQVDYQQYQIDAAYLTLTSNIVTTAITAASLTAQIQATQEIIQQLTDQLNTVSRQFEVGGASKANVLTQQTQLAQTRATLPPLQQSLAQANHALAVLIGQLPSESHLPRFNLDKLHLPTELPISIPSALIHQRPDIRAAEALVHVASGQVGVAVANLYPQITLTGAYGYTALTMPTLFTAQNNLWAYGGSLLQPIFNGGSLRAKKRAAIASYNQALAQYKQVVLQAFQNVADTLRALEHDAKTLDAQKHAEFSAHQALIITQKQYKDGGVSYLSLLTAEQLYQSAKISRIQAQAARYADTAALFQAMGGGWWNQGEKS